LYRIGEEADDPPPGAADPRGGPVDQPRRPQPGHDPGGGPNSDGGLPLLPADDAIVSPRQQGGGLDKPFMLMPLIYMFITLFWESEENLNA